MKTIYHSESQLERKFCDEVKKVGGMALKFISPSCAGVPDRIVLMPNKKIYFVEMKSEVGKISNIQKYIFKKFSELGFKVYILNSEEKIKNFLAEICIGESQKN